MCRRLLVNSGRVLIMVAQSDKMQATAECVQPQGGSDTGESFVLAIIAR